MNLSFIIPYCEHAHRLQHSKRSGKGSDRRLFLQMVLFSLPPDVWATIVDILLKDGTGGVQGFCGLREASRAARATAHAALPSLHVQNTTPERTLRLLTSCTGKQLILNSGRSQRQLRTPVSVVKGHEDW